MEEFEIIQDTSEQEETGGIEIGKFISGIWKRKALIFLLAIGFAIPFYYKAKNQVPIYRCKVLLKSDKYGEKDKLLSNLRQAEMRTRTFANRVASEMGLAIVLQDSIRNNYGDVFVEQHTTVNPVPGNYSIEITDNGYYYLYKIEKSKKVVLDSANVWDSVDQLRSANGISFRLNTSFVQTPGKIDFRVRPFEKASNELLYGVKMEVSKTGATMTLIMEGDDPDLLPRKLNEIAKVYSLEALGLQSRDNDSYRENLLKQLKTAEANVKKTEAEFQAFNSKYPLSLQSKKAELESQLKANDRVLHELPQQRARLGDLLDRLDKEENSPDAQQYRRYIVHELAKFSAMSDEPTLNILRETLSGQERKYDEMMKAYSAEYPDLIKLGEEINKTQDQIIAFASKYRNTLADQEAEYRTKRNDLQKQLTALPYDENRLMELERNKKIDENLYTYLLTEVQKLQVKDAATKKGITIMDRAVRPSHPINPGKKTAVLFGSGIGFFLGILISIILDMSDRKIYSFSDIEKYLKLKVLGAIPVVTFQDIPDYQDFEKAKQIDRQLVTHDYSPTPIGESYRALRTQLMYSKNTGRIQSLVLTSISPGEGKSFTASNLAIIMAQQKTNTLLVDADLRRGVLHNTFSVGKEPGFTNYLSNKSTLSAIVQQTHIPNLSVLSCGSMIPNPSELLGSQQMKRFLEEVRRKFDFILFDTPPLDAATDAVVLGVQADAVAVVVRAGDTNRTVAQEKLEIFQTVPARLIGVILNGSETALVNNSYSYYHY